jgi:homocysteine S-methyltransferase
VPAKRTHADRVSHGKTNTKKIWPCLPHASYRFEPIIGIFRETDKELIMIQTTTTTTQAKYRHDLPQLNGKYLLTDGGLETTLIFHNGLDLPYFAAFDLLRTRQGRDTLKAYYTRYAEIARARNQGFVLDAPTWRASKDWGDRLGYSKEALAAANREAIAMLFELREQFETFQAPFVISGNVGPRGDGYNPANLMSVAEAETYHAEQVNGFAAAGADMITVMTMTHVEEAIGIANAAAAAGIPAVISFTVETDGRLPTGQDLGEAIEQVDREADVPPAYFMVNCAHPDHFRPVVETGAAWTSRIRGLRTNASRMSHAELDEAAELDAGNPEELGRDHAALIKALPNLVVFGGCCGTDHRHIDAMATACCA